MNKSITAIALAIAFIPGLVLAAETIDEKVEDTTNDMSRELDKKLHRLEEATCTKSELECAKEKAEHRMEETHDAIKDKAQELKNDID